MFRDYFILLSKLKAPFCHYLFFLNLFFLFPSYFLAHKNFLTIFSCSIGNLHHRQWQLFNFKQVSDSDVFQFPKAHGNKYAHFYLILIALISVFFFRIFQLIQLFITRNSQFQVLDLCVCRNCTYYQKIVVKS